MNIDQYKKSPINQMKFAAEELSDSIYRAIQHIPVLDKKLRRTNYGNSPILSVEEGRKLIRAAVNSAQNAGGGVYGWTIWYY